MFGAVAISSWTKMPSQLEASGELPQVCIELLLPDNDQHIHNVVINNLGFMTAVNAHYQQTPMRCYFIAYDENSMTAGRRLNYQQLLKKDRLQQLLIDAELNIRNFMPELRYFEPRKGLFFDQDNIGYENLLEAYQALILDSSGGNSSKLEGLSAKIKRQMALENNQPTLRHIVPIPTEDDAIKVIKCIRDFERYRPHETHYVVQGLVCAAYVLRALSEKGAPTYRSAKALMSFYPRRWFYPKFVKNAYPIDQVNVWIFGWNVRRQYQQMVFWLHQVARDLIKLQIEPVVPYYRDRRLLGSGMLVSSNLLFHHLNEQLRRERHIHEGNLLRFLRGKVLSLPDGYLLLPLFLREMPRDMGLRLLQAIVGERSHYQEATLDRLYNDLYHFRLQPVPVDLFHHLYDAYNCGRLPILQAKGYKRLVCRVLYPFRKIVSVYGSKEWERSVKKNMSWLIPQRLRSDHLEKPPELRAGEKKNNFMATINRWYRTGG